MQVREWSNQVAISRKQCRTECQETEKIRKGCVQLGIGTRPRNTIKQIGYMNLGACDGEFLGRDENVEVI